jgi:hypothetical protein
MRDYGKVSPRFWTGKTGKSLRGDSETQLIALYLMTSPHANMIGVFHCPVMYMAHETGMTIEGASKGLRRLQEAGFCTFNEDEEMVWVHEMAAHQIGERLSPRDKQVIGIRRQFEQIPEGQIRRGFRARYAADYHLDVPAECEQSDEGPSKGDNKPLRSQEQEQEQEQDSKPTPSGVGVAGPEPVDPCPHQQIIDAYHEVLPNCTPVKVWTEQRRKLLRQRWRESEKRQRIEWWRKFFAYVGESEFLTGRSHAAPGRDPFVADLEWLLKPQNFAKVIEGKYHREEVTA